MLKFSFSSLKLVLLQWFQFWKTYTVKTLYNRIFNIRHKIAGNGSVSIKLPLYTGFYTKLNVWGSLGLNFVYDGGPIIENGGPIFLYKSRILEGSTSFREGIRTGLSCQTGVAKHPSHFRISTICIYLKIDRNFQSFFRAGF